MATQDTFQERTEPASPRKREKAREQGQVSRSLELNSALIITVGFVVLSVAGGAVAGRIMEIARSLFIASGSMALTVDSVHLHALEGTTSFFVLVGPVVGLIMVAGIAANVGQVGPLFTLEPIRPTLERLNPLTGLRRVLFSRRSAVEVVKGAVKTVVVAAAAAVVLKDLLAESPALMSGDAAGILGYLGRSAFGVGIKTGLAFLALAVLDYGYQRFEYERDLRMTREEVREEHKSLEGDPVVRGRIRTVQRRIAYRRMMQDVPRADVVVTNPTHLAVALRYDADTMDAPVVVAKGADHLAAKIRAVAQEHGVPIVEDVTLARALYRAADIGQRIPQKLFQAVAQLLAYIYALREGAPARRA
jgi:flagellar biosynthetic protein FlhB